MTDKNYYLIEPLETMILKGFPFAKEQHFNVFDTLQDNYDFLRWDKMNKDIEELKESIKLAKHAIKTSSFYLRTVTSLGEFTRNCHYNIVDTNTEKLKILYDKLNKLLEDRTLIYFPFLEY